MNSTSPCGPARCFWHDGAPMIAEALNFAATWPITSAPHRRAIRYSINLWSRARRCETAWAEHEQMTRAAICSVFEELGQRRTAVVLGSGLLRDVPIEELARAFDTVVLVDLVHLASVRLWLAARGLRNVRLVERDLSGLQELMSGSRPQPLDFLRTVPYLDLVVSTNLISQIGMEAARRLAAADRDPGEASRLVAAHLEGMRDLPCASLVVTDTCYDVIDSSGHLHEHFDLLRGVAVPAPDREWMWPVAPIGEESPDYRIEHKVIAFRPR